jgi:hypothetical protein
MRTRRLGDLSINCAPSAGMVSVDEYGGSEAAWEY